MRKLYLCFLLAGFLASCKKDEPMITPSTGDGVPVTVRLDQGKPGYPVSAQFEGLSYETKLLVNNPGILNQNNATLTQLLKNLGPGVLRIGGNTSDEVNWTGTERNPSTPENSLTTSDVDRLSAFARSTGWKVLFGLNLGNNKADAAVNEAVYAATSLKTNLYCLQFGNEPDVYNLYSLRYPEYEYNNYKADWERYYAALQSRLPGVPLSGPDVAYNGDWVRWFSADESARVKLLAGHHYNCGPATNTAIDCHRILRKNDIFVSFLKTLSTASVQYHVPYRISECNSVYGGGKRGVSDVFAASLWALDMMWQVAESNGEGVNFHGGDGLFYSPVATENGKIGPVYYAMLAFKYGSKNGVMIPVSIANNQNVNCTSYATANNDGSYSVTLINKAENKDISFTISLNKAASTAKIERLIAPAITSGPGEISFGGNKVQNDGTFAGTYAENMAISNKSFVVTVKAGSAAVITIR